MSEVQKRESGLSNEATTSGRPTSTMSLMQCCLRWLEADEELDHVTMEWAKCDERQLREGTRRKDPEESALKSRIEARIARIDIRRSRLLSTIVELEAHSLQEVAAKLSVAEHLLSGEGGVEHSLVSDALRLTSQIARIEQPCSQ